MAAKFGASLAAGAGACASLASSDEDEHPRVRARPKLSAKVVSVLIMESPQMVVDQWCQQTLSASVTVSLSES